MVNWLNKDSEIGLENYIIYRCDRVYDKNGKEGGVLIAVKKNIRSSLITKCTDKFESIAIKVNITINDKAEDIFIICSYITNNYGCDPYIMNCNIIDQIIGNNYNQKL